MIATTSRRASTPTFSSGFIPRPAQPVFKRIAHADPWAAHNASSHIPNAETLEALEDARLGRNLSRVYHSVDEMIADMLKDD